MTNLIHTKSQFRNVGMIEILNEPVQDTSKTGSMLNTFYPTYVLCACLSENLRTPLLHLFFLIICQYPNIETTV